MAPTRILCVDDDPAVLKSLEMILRFSGFAVDAVSTVADALERISHKTYDVLLSDLNIGEPGDGFTVVSAMRRVQPAASTFILTGYPDIESAIQAIRNQVDDYFTKPLNVQDLLAAIQSSRATAKLASKAHVPVKVCEFVRQNRDSICSEWLREVTKNPELAALPLTEEQRVNHLPELLEAVASSSEGSPLGLCDQAVELARMHGRARYDQGYSIPQIVFECRVLQQVTSMAIQRHLLSIDLSTLVPDTFAIGESVQAALEVSIRAYQGQIPNSLQSSLASLYKSPHLGVAIADEGKIVDANDALLKMIRRSREEMFRGEIDWLKMTPEPYRLQDRNAIEQLREYGASVPFEKEYILADGTRLPFLIGAVRLNAEPLQWSAFLVDLSEQRRLRDAEIKLHDWESKHVIINRLAHEINNPLAALMFTLHLLETHSDLSHDARELVRSASEMLDRVTAVVKKVLAECGADTGG
jgi:DNA-binding response OmpR family regulator/PAS domain-containing protein